MQRTAATGLGIAAALLSSSLLADQPLDVAGQLMLRHHLDSPGAGYCMGVAGAGQRARVDLPMNAHSCAGLDSNAGDSVTLTAEGRIQIPAFGDACVTVAGIDGQALPGSPVLIRPCGEQTPFFNGDRLQLFEFHANGQIELSESGLCLTAGEYSARTQLSGQRWRPLSVADCEDTESELAEWQFIPMDLFPGAIAGQLQATPEIRQAARSLRLSPASSEVIRL